MAETNPDAAACSTVHPDLFLPLTGAESRQSSGMPMQHPRIRMALRVCANCPLRDACLARARANREKGVWGGQYLSQNAAASARKKAVA
jgi:hypothetical protein